MKKYYNDSDDFNLKPIDIILIPACLVGVILLIVLGMIRIHIFGRGI